MNTSINQNTFLIVGLGNPGLYYKSTRHNIGFLILDQLAKDLGVNFKKNKSVKAQVAKKNILNKKLIFLKPETYMNESGYSVYKALKYYNLKLNNLIVVLDDLDLKFGVLRLRLKGSNGGHNGLKSIEEYIGANSYVRMKAGISNNDLNQIKQTKNKSGIKSFVLSRFNKEEKKLLPQICQLGASTLLDCIENKKSITISI